MKASSWITAVGFIGVALMSWRTAHAGPEVVYITRTPSVYHAIECPRLRFGRAITWAEATARYTPCPVCRPQREEAKVPLLQQTPSALESASTTAPASEDGDRSERTKATAKEASIAKVVDREVERAVAADVGSAALQPPSEQGRPFLRNSLIGAAVGGLIGGLAGSEIDRNEIGELGGNTARFGLIGGLAGACLGALSALLD